MMMNPPSTGRRRRRDGTHRGEGAAGGADRCRISMSRRKEAARRPVWVVAGLALLGVGKAAAQDLINGGTVELTCDLCECQGTSDGVDITVFDTPSNGERIASVGQGTYSEILSTSCGTQAIATGSTIYELSGVEDLDSGREMGVWAMEPVNCADADFNEPAPSSADCFSAPSSTIDFEAGETANGSTVTVSYIFATWSEEATEEATGAVKYKFALQTKVVGANDVAQAETLCLKNGFISMVFDVTILDETQRFNVELDFGEDTSADLPVDGTPASTEALVCAGPVTPAPVTPDTLAPVAPDTPTPVAPPPPPASPVPPETPAPVVAAADTRAPVAAEAETLSPVGGGLTGAPVVEGVLTDTPSPAVSGNAAMTPAPAAAVGGGNGTVTQAPTAAVRGGGVGEGNAMTTASPSAAGLIETPVPSAASSQAQATSSPVDNTELEENGCILPKSSPCTLITPVINTNVGIGDYYDPACGVPEGQERPTGCDPTSLCRQCYFNTPLYLENNNGSHPDFPDCPCCVLETYQADEAFNLDGPRCEDTPPAPTTMTQQPVPAGDVQRSFESLGFDNASWEMTPGEAAALAALGLLAALTFFPICSK